MKAKDILTIIVVFLLINYIFNFFAGPKNNQNTVTTNEITIQSANKDWEVNHNVTVKVLNNTLQKATIANTCPKAPLEVLYFRNNKWEEKSATAEIKCEGTAGTVINPGEEKSISFSSWAHALFAETGKYKIRTTLQLEGSAQVVSGSQQTSSQESTQNTVTGAPASPVSNVQTGTQVILPPGALQTLTSKTIETPEFEIKPQGWFSLVWTGAFYQPIYNILIFIASIVPFNDLGLAIILLTILIRTILLVPSQKALKSQRKMNELQPKLAKLKEKYKDNQEMIAKETMALWKEYKVNPFGSCLPLLIQFPVLIALFYVIQDGLNPNTAYLLYEPLKNFNVHQINVIFMGILDLTKINAYFMPLFVGGLQFLQMKLALVKKNEAKKDETKKEKGSEMEMASKTMMYIMPVMIALFTASVPAGVGLYWSISTGYGIIQQLVVNKQVDRENGVKVRVLPSKN